MRNDQIADMLGGPVIFGSARRASFWKAAEPHLWCAACRRSFPNGVHRLVAGQPTCPYADCDAALAASAHPWSEVRALRPAYPPVPWMAVQYVLPK